MQAFWCFALFLLFMTFCSLSSLFLLANDVVLHLKQEKWLLTQKLQKRTICSLAFIFNCAFPNFCKLRAVALDVNFVFLCLDFYHLFRKISNFCFVVHLCSCTRTKRRKRAKMTTWYTQTWTNQHLEQVKLNPFLTTNFFSTYQDFSNFRHETRERRKRVNGICWNQTSVKWVNLARNSLQLKNKYSRPIPNYAFNVFQEYDLFDRMTILILKL